ncbi:MAG: ATP-binding protein [Armatimonadota bacterium]
MTEDILKNKLARAEKKVSILEEMIETKTRELYLEKEALAKAKERAEKITKITPSAVFTVDAKRSITGWNKRAEEITGYTAEEITGKKCGIFAAYPCNEKCGVYADDVPKPITGKECTIKAKNGCLRYISKNADLIKDSSGNITGAIESFEDITQRKEAEEEIKKINEALAAKLKEEERNKLIMISILDDVTETRDKLRQVTEDLVRSNQDLEQFAYVASHDLQEPLRMVASYVQLIEQRYKDMLDDEAREFINYAVEGAHRMQALVNDLLAYSRVGTKGKSFEKTDLNAVIEDAINNLKISISDNNAKITKENLPAVKGDSVQLGQLFQNLIANALKFKGDKNPEIHIGAEDKEAEYLFSVKDNGIGIDPKFKERIFIIFQRLHKRTEYEGTGIGLAVCKKIVERHGGSIWVESDPGKGSVFYFTISKIIKKEAIANV